MGKTHDGSLLPLFALAFTPCGWRFSLDNTRLNLEIDIRGKVLAQQPLNTLPISFAIKGIVVTVQPQGKIGISH